VKLTLAALATIGMIATGSITAKRWWSNVRRTALTARPRPLSSRGLRAIPAGRSRGFWIRASSPWTLPLISVAIPLPAIS